MRIVTRAAVVALAFSVAAFTPRPGWWQIYEDRDALGQRIFLTEVLPDPGEPQIAMRYICGGLDGMTLSIALGDLRLDMIDPRNPNAGRPVGIGFEFEQKSEWTTLLDSKTTYTTTARPAPVARGFGTFEINGTEAAYIATQLQSASGVTVSALGASVSFPTNGAKDAIQAVIDACPFKA